MISHRYIRADSSATLTIQHLGAPGPFKTRITDISLDISVEFKLNEFVDNSAVELEGFSLYLPTKYPSH